MISVKNLRKTFGSFLAVDALSFHVARGEVLGLLGPNGAGKSTTMKMITGFLRPDGGEIFVNGIDVLTEPMRAQKEFGYLPEGAPAWPEMTPRAFLNFIASIRGLSGLERDRARDKAIAITELHAVLDQPIDTLSKGFRRRVGLAQAIMHDPSILIMDEPTDGLDPNQKHHVREAISEMAQSKAIIISTHILEEVEAICTRALVIDRGQLVANGTPAALAGQSRYRGAVSLTVPTEGVSLIIQSLQSWPEIISIEQVQRGPEMSVVLFPNEGQAQSIIARIQARSDWVVKGLALEHGRLDDVFRSLTGRP